MDLTNCQFGFRRLSAAVDQMILFFALSNLIFVFAIGFFAGLRDLVADAPYAGWTRRGQALPAVQGLGYIGPFGHAEHVAAPECCIENPFRRLADGDHLGRETQRQPIERMPRLLLFRV